MKPLLLSVILFIPFALGARYFFVCETLQWCDRASLSPQVTPDVFIHLPNGEVDSLLIGEFSPTATNHPLTPEFEWSLDKLQNVLEKYPSYALSLSGPIGDQEQRLEELEYYNNIGLARAAGLSKHLQRRGIAAERLVIQSHVVEKGQALRMQIDLVAIDESYELPALPSGEHLLDSTALTGLRFETGSTALTPTLELTNYATDLIEELNERPALQLTLTGHTDNRADAKYNDSLGMWRARAVAGYFKQLGFERPIIVASEGERKPVADNNTAAGRFSNRRVEVSIK